ncbi:MAG TPA: ATP-binding protein [Thermoanaerobaculia bacterium]
MITEIEIGGFKSLEKVRLKLGKLNLFVGANASGKSNFLDALRVFQGIGNGFSIEEIFQGKPKSATSEVWTGIRGSLGKARFMRQASPGEDEGPIVFRARLRAPRGVHEFSYAIGISPDRRLAIDFERLDVDARPVFSVDDQTTTLSGSYALPDLGQKGRSALPALTGLDFLMLLEGTENEERKACVRLLSNMQRLAPVPEILGDYSPSLFAHRIGESGENFASLVKSILDSKADGLAYVSWLRELLGSEAEEIEILPGAKEDLLFALKRGKLVFPANILSDGTLRFAALVAAFFQPDMPDVITIEEIENGIHPSRLRLLVELLKSQSSENSPQVFATTHSPVVLAWLDESDYDTTFFCKRDEETGASIIKPLSEIPHLIELVRKRSISDLYLQGWMEAAL